ncbi:hypothetical protein [Vibrio ouci]|uniref:hypothetical protein n=1 Tax=Vibrio ouci TaxID=2499078 RepID=UPI001FC8F799|nr:hypothetical protein [Vibrio ouci]
MPMFMGCFIVRSWRSVSCLTGSKSLLGLNQLAFQLGSCLGNLPLFCALVGKKGRWLELSRVASLGREVELLVSGWSPLVAKSVLTLWFSSESWSEIAVLSQLNHVFVVKHNKQFNSDSQRLALSLRLSLVFTAQCLSSVLALLTR